MKPIPEDLKQAIAAASPIVFEIADYQAWRHLEEHFYCKTKSEFGYIEQMVFKPDGRTVELHLYTSEDEAEAAEGKRNRVRQVLQAAQADPGYECPHCGYNLDDFVDQIMEDQ